MQNEEKIYGLIVQAQEMQKYCLEFKDTAEHVINSLPDTAKEAIKESSDEIIIEATKKAYGSLIAASTLADEASKKINSAISGALLKHISLVFIVGIIILSSVYFVSDFLINKKSAELDTLKIQIKEMESVIETLNSQYGKAEFSMCRNDEGQRRPCIRVDYDAGTFGDVQNGKAFMVIYGY